MGGWEGGVKGPRASPSSGSAVSAAHLLGTGEGHPGARGKSSLEGLTLSLELREASTSPPPAPAVPARQEKGRDPGAQVSSSSPGVGGARTSGSGECPFGDVRSLSAAPPVRPAPRSGCPRGRAPDALHIPRSAAPVRPHLPAHGCAASPSHGSLGPTARGTLGTSNLQDRAHTAPPPFVWVGSPGAPEGTARPSRIAFSTISAREEPVP